MPDSNPTPGGSKLPGEAPLGKPGLLKRIVLDINASFIESEARSHPLSQLFWECTLRCNLRCRHCGSDCRVSDVHPDMPFEDFEKVLLRIRERYDPHKILVILSGGEPLVRDDLADCGRRIYRLGYPWGLVTNGRLLSEERMHELLRAGMRSATVSLDGPEEEHDWMRGSAGSFIHASEAIARLAALEDFGFDVVSCINRRNFPKLGKLKEYLISLGVKRWRLFTVFPAGRALKDPEMQLAPGQFRELLDFIAATRKEGRIRASYSCEGFLGAYEGKVRDHLYSCQAGLSIASVRIDGAISGCNSIRARYDQGNIYTDDFLDVWENRFEPFRRRSAFRIGECESCKYWKWCLGGPMHLRDDSGRLLQCKLHGLDD
ncbi:MAG: TIGR04133 family radical SAM/SPASM protein [Bacteroidales bacterium]|nr:TIGR04133 family radical SAM/SPASM protein [Bacteroidales bacterium]